MKRYSFDLLLSEQELEEIINSLCGAWADEELSAFRTTLAKRLEHTRSHFFHKAKSREKA